MHFLLPPLSLKPSSLHLAFSNPPHSDSWKQNSSDLFCCNSFSLPSSLSLTLTVVIGSARIIQRLDIIYCSLCTTLPSPSTYRTRCPADELITLEILFLRLIPRFLWTALVLWCNGFNPWLVAPLLVWVLVFAAGLGDNGDKLSQTSSCSSSTTGYVVTEICS